MNRLGGKIHVLWVLRVCTIPVSTEDKVRREEGKEVGCSQVKKNLTTH